jgi:glc operon protein GlcG
MKLSLTLTALFATALLLVAADAPGVTFVSHDKANAALSKSGAQPLVKAPDLIVSGGFRDKAGQVEVHDVETDTFHVIDGEATLVTGGTIVGKKETGPGQYLGTDVKGGQTHKLTKGDVIVIPAGTPHWFKEVPKSISYYVVKVIKK